MLIEIAYVSDMKKKIAAVVGTTFLGTAAAVLYALGPLATDWKQPFRAVRMAISLLKNPQHIIFGDSRSITAPLNDSDTLVVAFGGRRISDFQRLAGIVCRAKPRRVTFALGVNDALIQNSPSDTGDDLRQLITQCSGSSITVIEPWPIDSSMKLARRYDEQRLLAVQEAVVNTGQAVGANVIRAPESVAGLTEDGVHFNAKGKTLYASALQQ